mgnify:CR=1 FL=1
MKKLYIQIIILLLFSCSAWSQNSYQLTQYFQNAPAFNPAFTGIDNFTDVKIGYRQSWTGIDNSARTLYASVYGLLVRSKYDKIKSNSLRISDPSLYESNDSESFKRSAAIKHGIGGYLINDQFGPFNRTYGFLSYSFHYPLTRNIQLAVGFSGGINRTRIDAEKVQVKNPDIDATYQSFLAGNAVSNNLDVNAGMVLYSERLYLGYAAQRLLQNPVFNNDEVSTEQDAIGHIISAGYIVPLGSDYLFMPSVATTLQPGLPSIIDINAKIRYQKNYWLGMNYRDSQALSIMGGVFINETYNLSYSYDFSLDGVSQYIQGSHELVLGIMLNNDRGNVPFAW